MADKKWVKVKALKQPLKKSENCKRKIAVGKTGEVEETTAKALEVKGLVEIVKETTTGDKK